jgi:hypothetical protein
MGEIIRFIPTSERERARLIREARAIYNSVFPPAAPASERNDDTVAGSIGSASTHTHCSDGVFT